MNVPLLWGMLLMKEVVNVCRQVVYGKCLYLPPHFCCDLKPENGLNKKAQQIAVSYSWSQASEWIWCHSSFPLTRVWGYFRTLENMFWHISHGWVEGKGRKMFNVYSFSKSWLKEYICHIPLSHGMFFAKLTEALWHFAFSDSFHIEETISSSVILDIRFSERVYWSFLKIHKYL